MEKGKKKSLEPVFEKKGKQKERETYTQRKVMGYFSFFWCYYGGGKIK
jgi:hypothetical protein